jgi:hypothetical protein
MNIILKNNILIILQECDDLIFFLCTLSAIYNLYCILSWYLVQEQRSETLFSEDNPKFNLLLGYIV